MKTTMNVKPDNGRGYNVFFDDCALVGVGFGDTPEPMMSEYVLKRVDDVFEKRYLIGSPELEDALEFIGSCVNEVATRNSRADREQYYMAREVYEVAGINIVSCGDCGSVMLHRVGALVLTCPYCAYSGDPCDFPDVYVFDVKGGAR